MKLWDNHIHTQFAYCTDDNMFPKDTIEIARRKGCGICIVEHAAHLYTSRAVYISDGFIEVPELIYDKENDRMENYLKYIGKFRSNDIKIGVEAEVFANGELTLKEQHKDCWDIILGAVHFLPDRYDDNLERGYLWAIESFAKCGVDVLAHPLRFFYREGLNPPKSIYRPAVNILRQAGIAAELNFHTNKPDREFFEMCLENGVKISLGSDSHKLFEVCDLAPHVRMLKELCGDGFTDVLFIPK